MDSLVAKAAILQEALPYIRRFHNQTVVVKYGGHAMVDPELEASFARDVCLLRYVGIRVLVVHGGGPQINDALERLGIPSTFSAGLRVTDDATMDVVEMVLAGRVNSQIVGLLGAQGGRAIGLSGRDDSLLLAERLGPVAQPGRGADAPLVDLGRVGRITRVKPQLLESLLSNGLIPVIAPIAIDLDGKPLNVNADSAAAEIAIALQAQKLVLMTDVAGVKDDQNRVLDFLDAPTARHHIQSGVIKGGMIPKVECALAAIEQSVRQVHIIDGRTRHALLLEIFTDSGVGTELRAQPRNKIPGSPAPGNPGESEHVRASVPAR
ncbi:MAG TPA: acetylglutamate kinase [Polyangiaceae bacterium]|jgi:acetylglutamate kinase|nr:acetylglutamate kinase [Polyangiaceae bacterium]